MEEEASGGAPHIVHAPKTKEPEVCRLLNTLMLARSHVLKVLQPSKTATNWGPSVYTHEAVDTLHIQITTKVKHFGKILDSCYL